MKAVVLAALSSLGLYGQWITGYYSSGDAVESVSAIPWSKCTQHCAVPNRLRNHMPQARLVIPSTRSVGIEDADNPAACAAATDFLPRPDIFQSQPSRRFRGNPNDHLEVNQHPRAAPVCGSDPRLVFNLDPPQPYAFYLDRHLIPPTGSFGIPSSALPS